MEEVHAMKRFCSVVSVALLVSATVGCTDRTTQNQHLSASEEAQLSIQAQAGDEQAAIKLERLQKAREAIPESDLAVASDIRDGWQWSDKEIAALTKRAKSGDIEAADRLYQYYAVHENGANTAFWEDWLFNHGDRGAIEKRVFRIHKKASKRPNDDPRKLAELQEAEKLLLSVYPEGKGSLFLEKLKSEIASIEKSK